MLAPADADWRSAAVAMRERFHLVYQFGLSAKLRVCALPPGGGHTLPQVIASASLADEGARALSMRISTSQLRALNAILRTEHVDLGPARRPPPTDGYALGTSAPSVPNNPPSRALLVVGHAQLQHVMIMLVDDNDDDLAMVRAEDICLDTRNHGPARDLGFRLGALLIEDRTQPAGSAPFRLLDSAPAGDIRRDSAEAGGDAAPAAPSEALVRARYISAPPSSASPDELSIAFNHVHLEWNPSTVTALVAILRLALGTDTAEGNAESPDDAGAGVHVATPSIDSGADVPRGERMRVTAKLASLSMSLNVDGGGAPLALLAMVDLHVACSLGHGGAMRCAGQEEEQQQNPHGSTNMERHPAMHCTQVHRPTWQSDRARHVHRWPRVRDARAAPRRADESTHVRVRLRG